jgi:hypothetical protein
VTEDKIFAEWVIIELMGHRRLAGFLTEQEIAGKGFLRLDIPGQPGATQLYNPTAVYAITPTTEDIARAVAATSQPAPVQRWELPAAPRDDDARAAAQANVDYALPYEQDEF